jgi:LuxR family maltose regulon positive regulatory protein
MVHLRLFWLGPPAIEIDDHPLRLEMRKNLALLAYLSLAPQSPTREILASLFWPEYDQQHAMANLRRSLSSLGRSLPPGLLQADRDIIGLRRVDWLKIDVDEFIQQLSYANQHTHATQAACSECLPYLEKAVALYRGNFFEGFSLKDCPEFDQWQFFQREGFLSQYANSIDKLSGHYASRGQWEKAITHARSWVAVDHLSEPARRRLAYLLAQSGQPWAAQRQLEELVRLLKEELDQKPDNETLKLIHKIQGETQEPSTIPSKPFSEEPLPTHTLEPLLKTKLYIPFSKGEKVFREQVLAKLDQIQDHALTILSAPAGYGKTTALSDWIKQSALPVGWLSLDDADNHRARFLTYLVAALQNIEDEVGEDVLALLRTSQTVSAQTVVTMLVSHLEKISYPFALVLDDFQVLHSTSMLEMLALLLERLPNQAHLVISTRVDPPLSLARLRARGELLEIRAQELRFTAEEVQFFFNELMRLGISSDDIAMLDERTEGWAVGLQMAALSLQRSTDKSKAIKAFSGSNRYILDYLLEEVMENQPKYVQDFLLQTSILDRMSGPLCDEVTRVREWLIETSEPIPKSQLSFSSQQILEYIESENLFILALDDERGWYRYHHLFAELLKARLAHFYPHLVQSLHRRASEWYERNGFIPAAVRHAVASNAFDFAGEMIERAVRTNLIWSSGDLALLLSWVDALPKEVLLRNPLLRIYLSAALYVTGDFKKSSQIIDELEKSLPEILKNAPNPLFIKQLFLNIRILHEATRGDISKALDDSSQSQALAAGDEMADLLRRNYTLLAYLVAGDVENALRIARPAYEGFRMKGYTLQALSNIKNTADVYILQGRLNDAIDLCQQAIMHCELSGVREPIAGILGFPIGTVLFERDELELAEDYVQKGLDLLAKGPLRNDFGQGYALLAMIKQAQGDRENAIRQIDQALQIAEYAEIPRIIHLIQAYQARIWLAQGEIDCASIWAKAYRLIEPTEYPREIEGITLAQVLVRQDKYAEASRLLEHLLIKARARGRYGRVIEILALLAMLRFDGNRSEEALYFLEESLRLVYREGHIRVYLDQGEPMQALLRLYQDKQDAEDKNNHPDGNALIDYVDNLLIAFRKKP